LKDLGQIHKYPQIESVSQELSQQLKRLFQENKGLPGLLFTPYRKSLYNLSSTSMGTPESTSGEKQASGSVKE